MNVSNSPIILSIESVPTDMIFPNVTYRQENLEELVQKNSIDSIPTKVLFPNVTYHQESLDKFVPKITFFPRLNLITDLPFNQNITNQALNTSHIIQVNKENNPFQKMSHSHQPTQKPDPSQWKRKKMYENTFKKIKFTQSLEEWYQGLEPKRDRELKKILGISGYRFCRNLELPHSKFIEEKKSGLLNKKTLIEIRKHKEHNYKCIKCDIAISYYCLICSQIFQSRFNEHPCLE